MVRAFGTPLLVLGDSIGSFMDCLLSGDLNIQLCKLQSDVLASGGGGWVGNSVVCLSRVDYMFGDTVSGSRPTSMCVYSISITKARTAPIILT